MTAVLLFARAPRRGQVKTRLARDIGPARALSAYRLMGRRVAQAVSARYPLTVWYTPPDGRDEVVAWLGPVHRYRPQCPGDLGARLAYAVETHFAEGAAPVIVIGADAPSVDAGVIREAEEALTRADVVLGPAYDGGYYLVGLRRADARPFVGIPWSTTHVTRVTAEVCGLAGLLVEQLAPRGDVDTVEDLTREGLTVP